MNEQAKRGRGRPRKVTSPIRRFEVNDRVGISTKVYGFAKGTIVRFVGFSSYQIETDGLGTWICRDDECETLP